MNSADFDKLVEIVVSEVHSALQASVNRSSGGAAGASTANFTFEKKLLTEADALRILRKPVRKLYVNKDTIITPLANDHLRTHRIKIMRSETAENSSCGCRKPAVNSRSIALLAANCTETARDTIRNCIRESGFDPVEVLPAYSTPSAIDRSSLEIADKIAGSQYMAAVIIDENAFSLKMRASRIQNVHPAMCWDLAAGDACPKRSQSNMLFVNNRLLGFKKLDSIMRSWLDTFKDENP
jgi:ribose 5-phosphate isomerase RpiB